MSWSGTTTYGTWGHLRVTIAGKDVTWFRGAQTMVGGWSSTDPYGPASASLTLPQVTVYDDRDHDPALRWLTEGAVVRIDQVRGGELVSRTNPPFFGIIDSIEESDHGTAVSCAGNFNGRLSTVCHQPPLDRRPPVDGGRVIWRETSLSTHVRILPFHGLATGIKLPAIGSRDMTKLGRIDECLALLVKEDGSSVTILPDTQGSNPHNYRMQWRTLKADPDATVDAGAHGVQVTLRRDLLDMPTAVYGEGVAPGGERWRNRMTPNLDNSTPVPPYPFHNGRSFGKGTADGDTDTGDGVYIMALELFSDGHLHVGPDPDWHTYSEDVEDAVQEMQRGLRLPTTGRMTASLWQTLFKRTGDVQTRRGSYFAPLAIDTRTRYLDRAPDGTPMGKNPDYDGKIIRVQEFINYGEGVHKAAARRNARAILSRAAAKNGTVVLSTDPAECSRFDLRPGMTLKLRHYSGDGVRLYVSQVDVDWGSDTKPVTLQVSTTPKHYLDLATIKERNRSVRRSPAKRAAHQHRRSAHTSDAIKGWEGDGGAGLMRPRKLGGGHWNVFRMSAAERGVMREITYDTSPNVEFYLAVFSDRVTRAQLHKHVGNPSLWAGGNGKNRESVWQASNDWLTESGQRLVEAWGNPFNPCGYYPHHHHAEGEYTDHPVTGRLRDYAAWDFHTEAGDLWVAVWPSADCTGHGRAKIQIHEGA